MPSGESSGKLLATIKIKIDGAEISEEQYRSIAEVKVTDNLHVPDVAQVRLNDDSSLKLVDDSKLKVGAELEIDFSGAAHGVEGAGQGFEQVFKGLVTSVEPIFEDQNASIVLRAFDRSHTLFQGKKNRVFQKQSIGDIARKVFGDAGFSSDVDSAANTRLDFAQQANESDWDFLSKLAARYDMEILMQDKRAIFKKADRTRPAAPKLEWGVNLISFVARVTSAQVPEKVVVTAHDSKTKRQFKGESKVPASPESKLGIGTATNSERSGRVVNLTVAAETQDEVTAMAKAAAARYARSTLEANGSAHGDPKLKAGTEVEISGIGARFGGKYILSQTTHVYRGKSGYTTQFTISGAPRTLSAMLGGNGSGASKSSGGGGGGGGSGGFEGLTIGIVTNNSDPDENGRVKVKYPSNPDQSLESTWARVIMPSARKEYGFGVIPQVNDEVVVGFEHGDLRRPYVLGSVWGGKDKGGKDVLDHKEGSIQGKTPGAFRMHSDKEMKLTSDKEILIEAKQGSGSGNVTMKAAGAYEHKVGTNIKIESGANVEIKAGANMTLKSSAPLKIEAPMIEVNASGALTLKGATVSIG